MESATVSQAHMMGCSDLCQGLEARPVSLLSDELPLFQYTPEHVAGAGADLDPTEISFPGCDCLGTVCLPDSCPCLRHSANYSELRLIIDRSEVRHAKPVFECNIMCKCGDSCPNRVVQRGLQVQLQVFQTGQKGWGLRTLEPISVGQFVCEYAGEILGFREACRRVRLQRPSDSNYIIVLREHFHGGQMTETFVDPTYIGNIGRFLNHSCEPNLFMVPVRIHSAVPRLALYAARDVASGEELSYDYSGKFHNPSAVGKESETAERSEPRKRCYCGACSCRGFLPYDASLYPAQRSKNIHL
ncbi:histone-lysine N-methyltransferase SETMAR-like [Rhinatrema bivittatum]|uniref:histone-lysine N-methyltransferase SETMAR-like n=1 Tax=Rhinatrema bivittatum TaxID=194408 RepID=UPI00112D6919|nr:histone-lysine N-methyltransferase SETMAR-like [Rhinatrema bivittatum]XP_029464211.1 histone-lysine N-methyltransferase SETMAR-like [Rhinatrema bivittatum]XP_029464219.1 histone-lysine N-methyltransferase SETMAR-like [Rhinatrema bivittatum]